MSDNARFWKAAQNAQSSARIWPQSRKINGFIVFDRGRLPAHWRTLQELAKLDDEQFAEHRAERIARRGRRMKRAQLMLPAARRWPIRWGPHAHIDNTYDLTPTEVKLFAGRFRCVDCQTCTLCIGQYYMVKSEVWAASGLGSRDGMLCLDCLGQRIGREVAYDDFAAIVPSCWFVRWPAPSSLAGAGVPTTPWP